MIKQSLLKMAAVASLLATAAFGQSFTAGLRGNVTDASGAAVPGAKVVATEADRNIPHNTTTDAEGRYTIAGLPPGAYTLSVEAAGFKKFLQQSFALAVQQQATLDVRLELGDIYVHRQCL